MDTYKIKSNTSNKLVFFSFVFTMIIAMYHSQIHYHEFNLLQKEYIIIQSIFEFCVSVSMAYFFMKTGYFLYLNTQPANIGLKIKSRLFTIALPFFVWNVLYMFAFVIVRNKIPSTPIQLISGFTLFPYDGPLWYLFCIFILTFLAPWAIKIRSNKKACVTILFLIIVISTLIYCLVPNNHKITGWIIRVVRYFPAYCIGAAVAMLNPDLIAAEIKSKYRKAMGLVLLSLFLIGHLFISTKRSLNVIDKTIFMNGIILFTIVIWTIVPNELFKNKYVFCKNSFFIYASHSMISAFCYKILIAISLSIHCPFIIAALLIPALCALIVFFVALVFSAIIKKIHCEKIMLLLTEGR